MTEKRAALVALIDTLRPGVASVRTLDDNSALIRLRSGEDVVTYLIDDESLLLPTSLRQIARRNTARHVHTLFLLAQRTLPGPGEAFSRHELRREAFSLLLDLYWGKVYCYQLSAAVLVVRPVYSDHWRAVYGEPVDLHLLDCDIVYLETPYKGVFNVANFGGRFAPMTWAQEDPLQPFYDLLGLAISAGEDEVKRAYRRLARRYHPDANPSPEANTMMQRLNEAYEKLMERFR